jgi:hypothetical protein
MLEVFGIEYLLKLEEFDQSVLGLRGEGGLGLGLVKGEIILLEIFEDDEEVVVVLPAFHVDLMDHAMQEALPRIDLFLTQGQQIEFTQALGCRFPLRSGAVLLPGTHERPQLFGIPFEGNFLGRLAKHEGSGLVVGEFEEIAEQVHD